jgi:hypothetical protein
MFSFAFLKKNGIGFQIKFLFVHAGKVLPKYLIKSVEFLVASNSSSIVDVILTHKPNSSILNKISKLNNVNLIIQSPEKYDIYKAMLDEFYPKQVNNRFWYYSVLRLLLIEDWAKTVAGPFIHLESDCLFLLTETQSRILFENSKNVCAPFDRDGRCVPSIIYFPNKIEAINLFSFIRKILDTNFENWPNFYLSDQELLTLAFNEGLIDALPSEPANRSINFKIGENFVLFDPAYIGQYLFGKDPRHNYFIRKGGMINLAGDSRFVTNSTWSIDYNSQFIHNLKITESNQSFIIANLHNYAKVTRFLPNLETRFWTSTLMHANKNKFPIGKIDFGMITTKLVEKLIRYQ